MTAWREKHPDTRTDAITAAVIKDLRGSKYGIKKLASVGYWWVMHNQFCLTWSTVLTNQSFGGKFVARFLAPGKGLDAGFTAHPSGVIASEWTAVSAPISIAFGGMCQLYSPLYSLHRNQSNWQNLCRTGWIKHPCSTSSSRSDLYINKHHFPNIPLLQCRARFRRPNELDDSREEIRAGVGLLSGGQVLWLLSLVQIMEVINSSEFNNANLKGLELFLFQFLAKATWPA